MESGLELERGQEAFASMAWKEAYDRLAAVGETTQLDPEDLMRLAMAAYLIGRDDESIEVTSKAHHEAVSRGDIERAARCAFWLFFQLMNKGDVAQAGGWFARGRRVLDESQLDCVEQGYLLVPPAVQALYGGQYEAAYETFGHAAEIARRFDDKDLSAFGSLGIGQSLVGLGRTSEGVAVLDEVMVSVTSGEVSAIICGIVYCAVIEACQKLFDTRRAQEWTGALTRWCAAQPDLVPYRGQCLVHRAQIMALKGSWTEAFDEAERARSALAGSPDEPAVGMAYYELAELQRLRGDLAAAEAAYREASQWGHSPQPGLARLRLAQGQIEAATAAMRREVDEAHGLVARAKLLPACVEIMLAADDIPAARGAADELAEIAVDVGALLLYAIADTAQGAVHLAEDNARAALGHLRRAHKAWQELEAPYEAARARVLMSLSCRALGDEDTAAMELDSARVMFEQLGATPDLVRLDNLAGTSRAGSNGLTGREVEVLALVATGKTNREIASDLVISEKTVARHISNIFVKLEVTSRSAATAYAFKHHLA